MVAAVAAIACDMAYHLTTDFAVSCGFLHMLAGSFALCDVKGRSAGKSIAACQMTAAQTVHRLKSLKSSVTQLSEASKPCVIRLTRCPLYLQHR